MAEITLKAETGRALGTGGEDYVASSNLVGFLLAISQLVRVFPDVGMLPGGSESADHPHRAAVFQL